MKKFVDISKKGWLKNTPINWSIFRVKDLFVISKEKNSGEDIPVLSLTQKGIKIRDISDNEGQIAETYENYTRVRKNDIVFNPMDLCTGAVDLSVFDGVISLAYTSIREKNKMSLFLRYYKYFFQWHYLNEIFFPFGQGVSIDHRWTLKDDILMNFPVLVPPLENQKKIAFYLDKKTPIIDDVIEKNEKLISLLREKRSSLITQAVTKGFHPKVDMRASGIDLIDRIPQDWKIMKARFLFGQVSEKDRPESELLSVYREYGVIPKSSREDNKNVASEDLSTYKFVEKGNLVFNKMKTWQGSIAVSNYEGIVSPAYYVAEFLKPKILLSDFAHFLLRSKIYVAKYASISTGIRPGQWDMGFDDFKDVPIILPPIEEQKLIVEYINKETKLTDIFISKIELQNSKLNEYRTSLICSAVTGVTKI